MRRDLPRRRRGRHLRPARRALRPRARRAGGVEIAPQAVDNAFWSAPADAPDAPRRRSRCCSSAGRRARRASPSCSRPGALPALASAQRRAGPRRRRSRSAARAVATGRAGCRRVEPRRTCATSTPAPTLWSCRRFPTRDFRGAVGARRQRGHEPGTARDRHRRRRRRRRRAGPPRGAPGSSSPPATRRALGGRDPPPARRSGAARAARRGRGPRPSRRTPTRRGRTGFAAALAGTTTAGRAASVTWTLRQGIRLCACPMRRLLTATLLLLLLLPGRPCARRRQPLRPARRRLSRREGRRHLLAEDVPARARPASGRQRPVHGVPRRHQPRPPRGPQQPPQQLAATAAAAARAARPAAARAAAAATAAPGAAAARGRGSSSGGGTTTPRPPRRRRPSSRPCRRRSRPAPSPFERRRPARAARRGRQRSRATTAGSPRSLLVLLVALAVCALAAAGAVGWNRVLARRAH